MLNQNIQFWRRLFVINMNNFPDLKLEITPVFPALNECKIETHDSAILVV